jgi:hypothetical protein
MFNFNLDPNLFLQVFGLIFIGMGGAVQLGLWKKWYWRSQGRAYGYIPVGLLFILYSFNSQAQQKLGANYWLFNVAFGALAVLSVWLFFRPPNFMKPAWVRWVEAYPPDVYKAMRETAQNDPDWDKHMSSPEAVDEWVRTLKKGKPKQKLVPKVKK